MTDVCICRTIALSGWDPVQQAVDPSCPIHKPKLTDLFGIDPDYTKDAAEEPKYTESELKVAAEAGRRIGRAEAGIEIEAACEADTFYDVAARYHFARIARSISRQPPGATPEPQTASTGRSGYPQDSKAATEPPVDLAGALRESLSAARERRLAEREGDANG